MMRDGHRLFLKQIVIIFHDFTTNHSKIGFSSAGNQITNPGFLHKYMH
jgi:hypothetical protein